MSKCIAHGSLENGSAHCFRKQINLRREDPVDMNSFKAARVYFIAFLFHSSLCEGRSFGCFDLKVPTLWIYQEAHEKIKVNKSSISVSNLGL